jgi:hypothetical protein
MPAILSTMFKLWRFLFIWCCYSLITGYLMSLCMHRKMHHSTPRKVCMGGLCIEKEGCTACAHDHACLRCWAYHQHVCSLLCVFRCILCRLLHCTVLADCCPVLIALLCSMLSCAVAVLFRVLPPPPRCMPGSSRPTRSVCLWA